MIDLYPNETIIFMWLIFAAVFVILSKWVFKPTINLMEERQNRTERLGDATIQLTEMTKQLLSSYEEKIAKARLQAGEEREKIISKARKEEAAIVNEARKENEALLDEMKRELKKEKKEAELQLKQYTMDLAKLMASKILERKVA